MEGSSLFFIVMNLAAHSVMEPKILLRKGNSSNAEVGIVPAGSNG
jgi:hypothetical protein